MITERRKKLFRCAQKLQRVANGKATPEAAEFFFRNFLRLDRVTRGLSPFRNTYHPKASLDTNPGEGAAKQSGAASSTLCEVGIREADSLTTAVERPHIDPQHSFDKQQTNKQQCN